MHKEGEEVHATADEARAGSTPHKVRWILAISLGAAIVLLSLIWMVGAASQGERESEISVTAQIEAQEDGRDTDGVLGPGTSSSDTVADDVAAPGGTN